MRINRPKITGLPAFWPTCAGCGQKLRPRTKDELARNELGHVVIPMRLTARRFVNWNAYHDLFCTLRCAARFAAAAFRAGYRRTE